MLLTQDSIHLILLIITAIVTIFNNKQGKVIHSLVNSKMTTALAKIESLEKEIADLKAAR